MSPSVRPARNTTGAEEQAPPDAIVKAAAGWIAQFGRTLKTCRLYDASNPAVIKFREDLTQAAMRLVSEYGAITYRFEATDVTLEGVSLHPARSREDNLSYPFHRDGVRGITLTPAVEPREIDALVDAVLAVTGQNLDDDDLVTLLWEANLRHLEIDYIPAQGEVGSGGTPPAGSSNEGPLLPWPTSTEEKDEKRERAHEEAGEGDGNGRSEDWMMGDFTVEVEASFVELDTLAPLEVERFRREFTQEHLVSPVTTALAIAIACVNANALPEDRREMARFLPRVLRGALAMGMWVEAGEALRTLRELAQPDWSEETFVQELLQPVSITRVVERLDGQEPTLLPGYLELAHDLGDPGIDWMTLVLSESQDRGVRQVVADALAERCRENPERLGPWLNDSRWYVVRNIVHILGWIGGPATVGLLQVALRHEDMRVRWEVVSALQQVDLRMARPLLIRSLEGADTRLFCQVLHQLSVARDPATARYVFAYLQQERFPERPAEERRAIYAALASIGGDEIVPELEAELLKANWFDREQEIHRHAVARCLGRIATQCAREALARAAESKRPPVRQAALAGLASLPPV